MSSHRDRGVHIEWQRADLPTTHDQLTFLSPIGLASDLIGSIFKLNQQPRSYLPPQKSIAQLISKSCKTTLEWIITCAGLQSRSWIILLLIKGTTRLSLSSNVFWPRLLTIYHLRQNLDPETSSLAISDTIESTQLGIFALRCRSHSQEQPTRSRDRIEALLECARTLKTKQSAKTLSLFTSPTCAINKRLAWTRSERTIASLNESSQQWRTREIQGWQTRKRLGRA